MTQQRLPELSWSGYGTVIASGLSWQCKLLPLQNHDSCILDSFFAQANELKGCGRIVAVEGEMKIFLLGSIRVQNEWAGALDKIVEIILTKLVDLEWPVRHIRAKADLLLPQKQRTETKRKCEKIWY